MNNSSNHHLRPKCATAADFYRVASSQECKLRMRDFACRPPAKVENKGISTYCQDSKVTEENLIKLQSNLIKQHLLVQPKVILDDSSFGQHDGTSSRLCRSLSTRRKLGRPFSTEMRVRIVCYRDIDSMFQHLVKNDSSIGFEMQEMTFSSQEKYSGSNLANEICSTFGLSEWAFVRVIRRMRSGKLQPVLLRAIIPPTDCPVEFVKREIALPRYKARMKIFVVGSRTNEVRFCEECDETVQVVGSRFSLSEPTYILNEEVQATPELSWSPSCSPSLVASPFTDEESLWPSSATPDSLGHVTPHTYESMQLPRTPPPLIEDRSPCRTPLMTSPAEAEHKLLMEALSTPTDAKRECPKGFNNRLEFGDFLMEKRLPAINLTSKENLVSEDKPIRLPGISSIFGPEHMN